MNIIKQNLLFTKTLSVWIIVARFSIQWQLPTQNVMISQVVCTESKYVFTQNGGQREEIQYFP